MWLLNLNAAAAQPPATIKKGHMVTAGLLFFLFFFFPHFFCFLPLAAFAASGAFRAVHLRLRRRLLTQTGRQLLRVSDRSRRGGGGVTVREVGHGGRSRAVTG